MSGGDMGESENMEEIKLKPCPFCGGEAEFVGYKSYWIICVDCTAESAVYDSKAEAVEAWNRRVGQEDEAE